ncbi:hypothetical protein AAE478_005942 [Parahypoxylon ruwenzoriense]
MEPKTPALPAAIPAGSAEPNVVNDGEEIFLLACQCHDYFKDYLEDPSNFEKYGAAAQGLVEDYQRRFKSWAAYLGVFAERRASLDRGLRNREDVRDIVVLLLTMLRRNVAFLPKCPPLDPDEDTASSYSNRSDSDADSDVEMTSENNLFNIALRGIDESLAELNRMGVAVRQSSSAPETIRVRNFAARNPDPSMFEMKASIAIESLYPGAPNSLRQQLVRAMIYRQSRVRFRKSRHEKLAVHRRDLAQVAQTGQGRTRIKDLLRSFSKSISPSQNTLKVKDNKPETVTSMNTKLLVENLVKAGEEPPVPKAHGKTSDLKCEWCFRILEPSFIENERWTVRGRNHYLEDLEPYICISEECEQELPSFASASAWLEHMESTHSPTWPNDIHRQAMWRCNLSHEDEGYSTSERFFSTPDDLYNHFWFLHPHQKIDGVDIERFHETYLVQDWRQKDVCPLCCYAVESARDTQDGHPALSSKNAQQHGSGASNPINSSQKPEQEPQRGSRKRSKVTYADAPSGPQRVLDDHEASGSKDERYSPKNDEVYKYVKGRETTPPDRTLARHIATHLNHIMLLSIRLMVISDIETPVEEDDQNSVTANSESGVLRDVDSRMGDLDSITTDLAFPQDLPTDGTNIEFATNTKRTRNEEWAFVVPSDESTDTHEDLYKDLYNDDTENQDVFNITSVRQSAEEGKPEKESTKKGKSRRSTIWERLRRPFRSSRADRPSKAEESLSSRRGDSIRTGRNTTPGIHRTMSFVRQRERT